MPVGLGRTMWLITVAGAWTAIWYYLSDETVTVESDSGAHEFKYVHILSESAKDGVELPLVIALHGNGDTPNGFYESLLEGFEEPARFVLFRAPKDFSGGRLRGTAWPHSAQAIKRYGERLVRAIELVSEKYPSRCKPILLGFSGGAHMAYYQAANHPQKFRLIVPVAGKLFPDLVPIGSPRSTKGLPPVHIFHGERDDLVSIRAGQGAAEVLRKRNMDVSLAMLTGGHDAIFRGGRYPLLELLQQTALACQ